MRTRQLTESIAKGDERAFEEFYDRYYDRLYRYLIVIAPRHENLVMDALQDSMLRVLRYIKPFEEEQAFWGWLRRLARTALFDQLRRRNRTDRVERQLVLVPPADAAPGETNPEQRLLQAMHAALAQLPAPDRELVEAYYFEGLAQKELAEARDTTRKAIESKLARLRRKMKITMLDLLNYD